jgi:hypothetical protein
MQVLGQPAERLIERFDRDRRRVDGLIGLFGYAHRLELAIWAGSILCMGSRFGSTTQGTLFRYFRSWTRLSRPVRRLEPRISRSFLVHVAQIDQML